MSKNSKVDMSISTHDLTKRSTPFEGKIPVSESFQLATSGGGRISIRGIIMATDISTHDLTKRSTIRAGDWKSYQLNFNSRPHEEVDLRLVRETLQYILFQLTTSRRGRHSRFR